MKRFPTNLRWPKSATDIRFLGIVGSKQIATNTDLNLQLAGHHFLSATTHHPFAPLSLIAAAAPEPHLTLTEYYPSKPFLFFLGKV
jgi:hypothetical protein